MKEKKCYRVLADFLGGVCILLGLLVILGWHIHSDFIIQLYSTSPPMMYNTALCFVLAGLSLICLDKYLIKLSCLSSCMLLLLSGSVLIEHLTNINLGIDELFVKGIALAAKQYPGRMTSNTALSFITSAVCLLVLSCRCSVYRHWFSLVVSFFTLSLGFISLLSHFIDFTDEFGTGQLVIVALHTSIGLIVLSLGVIFYILSKNRKHSYLLLPLIATFVILNITFFGWQMTKKNQEHSLEMLLMLKVENVIDVINTSMQERVTSFSRITYRWLNRESTPEKEWRADVMHYINDQPGYTAIELVDSNYNVRWVAPSQRNELAKKFNFNNDVKGHATIVKSLATQKLQLSEQMNLIQGGKGVLLFSPILKKNQFDGLMVGVINTQVFLDNIIKKAEIKGYNLRISDNAGVLYSYTDGNNKYHDQWNKSLSLPLFGQHWKVTMWPSKNLYNEVISPFFPLMILIVGFIIAVLAGFLIHTVHYIKENSNKLHKIQFELATARERLQGIIEGSSDLVAALDLNYDFIAFNAMYKSEIYRLFKVNVEMGMNFRALAKRMSVENRKKSMMLWEKAMKGTTFTVVETFKDPHHTDLDFEIHYNPIRDFKGTLIGVSHIATNVHKRIENERKLESSKCELESLVKSLEGQNKELELLKELMSLLQSTRSLNDGIEIIASYTKRILPGTSGSIYLSAPDDVNNITKILNWGKPVSTPSSIKQQDCLALLRHQSYYVSDTSDAILCNHLKHEAQKPESSICLPLFAQNEMLGLLYLELGLLGQDNQRLIALAQIIAEQVALSVYNIRLRDVLKIQSTQDSLTALYNRRFFEEYIHKEIMKAKTNPFCFALLLIDIDFFKKTNDTYGHLAGDKVLQEVAHKLRENCRQNDIVSRWGGEEFMIFLRVNTLDIAKARAELIRKTIEHMIVTIHNDEPHTVTISIGVSFYPYDGQTMDDLISKADEALYKAKNSGRNRVVVHSHTHNGSINYF